MDLRRALAALHAIARGATLTLAGAAVLNCSSSAGSGGCFPDSDGLTGGSYTISLMVDDNGFSKTVINTQNNATVMLTLTNNGTQPHGFQVDCENVATTYPNLPPMCPSMSCFPAGSTIAPLAPGQSMTVTFFTPVPDNVIHTFRSSAPSDASVSGLNNGQWSLI